MIVTVPVAGEQVRVSERGALTCTCQGGDFCAHIEAVVSGDVMLPPGPLAEALALVPLDIRIQVLTRRLRTEKEEQKRFALQAALAQLLVQRGE